MNLFMIRHATAASKSTWADDDGLRPLTKTGRERFCTAVSSLVGAGVLEPDLVLTSPLVRARETAEVVVKELKGRVPLAEDARLGGDFGIDDLRAILAENASVASLAIVGHNPSFTEVLSGITGEASLSVRKGSVALVEIEDVDAPSGRLMWLAPPELFRPCD